MTTTATTRDVLLRRSGLVFVEPQGGPASEPWMHAVDIHLADLGYAASTRLRDVLAQQGAAELERFLAWTAAVLGKPITAGERHEPLFRKFPDDIPTDTFGLWVELVLVHFCQAEGQACLFCRQVGTTHVLTPCHHVICDRCFDGSNYSACPVCKRDVDPSPFFRPAPPETQRKPVERVRFKLLDLGDDLGAASRALFLAFCARPQAMSPNDRDDFAAVVRDHGAAVIPWLPEKIPVKENVALVLGTLFQHVPVDVVLPVARVLLATATDVLRFVAVASGADASLQGEARSVDVGKPDALELGPRWAAATGKKVRAQAAQYKKWKYADWPVSVSINSRRFKVMRLRRPLRRALLSILDAFPAERLHEDMLRHRSMWTWVGQLLHPHDYASRFPNAARGFEIVRGTLPDGEPAPGFQTFNGKVEATAAAKDARAMLALLRPRPGELGRRYDHVLRVAGADVAAVTATVEALVAAAPSLSTPLLLTLSALLPHRARPAPLRMYWPKGKLALGASGPDRRPPLRHDAIAPAVRALEAELLRRFGDRPGVGDVVIDAALADIVVPFNERTASRAAVALTRGSRVAVPDSKALRLFLHWCEPKHGRRTDVDLSVAFYDDKWQYRSVCSYYQLTAQGPRGSVLARSSGDRTSAPFPDGASEFVDIDRAAARAAGYRYAAMVVNAYSGMTFSELERATAGVMLRDDLGGTAFDPRTVELAFDLQGENGMFFPLLVDLADDTLHWLDVYASGQLQLNNVETSKVDLARLGSQLLAYFGSGVRPSMYDLALLHGAARARRVLVRARAADRHAAGPSQVRVFTRADGEARTAFLARLRAGAVDALTPAIPPLDASVLAVLLHGDVDLPAGTQAYAVFRDRLTATMAAADLLA